MTHIHFKNKEHRIDWKSTPEQDKKMLEYVEPIKRALSEKQAAKYRENPTKYTALGYVEELLHHCGGVVSEPYLGAIGGSETYIMHKTEDGFAVQYQYLDAKPIWLTDTPCTKTDCVYRVTPTALGYIVHCEIDITDYDSW